MGKSFVRNKYRTLVTSRSFGEASPEALALLREATEVIRPAGQGPFGEDKMREWADGCHGLLVGADVVSEAVIHAALPSLSVISKHGVGVENVDLEAARQAGVVVTNVPGVNREAVADLTLGLLLAVYRRICEAWDRTRKGEWPRLVGRELKGKVIGIVGLGEIGQAVARRCLGFGMEVKYHDIVRRIKFEEECGVQFVPFEELIRSSDVISIHCPLAESTRGLFNREALFSMKQRAVLINTARGPIVDEGALLEALQSGWLFGAGLDVLCEEPPPLNSVWRQLDNVIVTSHIAAYTEEALVQMDQESAENVIRVLRGDPPLHKVV